MAGFVFVHGAFSGAWIWQPLAARLGPEHTAAAMDLPGLGEDDTPPGEVTLDVSAARVCGELAAAAVPQILVGHSMGGIIATQAAARAPDKVAALVYVAAFMPRNGQSLLDLTHLPEGAGDQVQANIVVTEDPPVAVMPAGPSQAALYGDCSAETAEWATSRHRPQPLAPMATPVSVPAGTLDDIPRFYVKCTHDRAIPLALQERMIADNACAGVYEIVTDHTPHLSRTDELATILREIAARAG